MKIFWITTRHSPDRGGMARSSARIVHSFRDRGHEVRVLHLSDDRDSHNQGAMNLTMVPGKEMLKEPGSLFWNYKTLMEGAVIIGFGGDLAGYLAVLWSQWLRLKSLVLFRGNDFDRIIHDLKRGWMTHFILSNADCVGAVSTEMSGRIRAMRKGPVVFTPNSLDLEDWSAMKRDYEIAEKWKAGNLKDRMPVVGIIGELKSKKGLDTAFTIFESMGFRERAYLLSVGSLPEDALRDIGTTRPDYWKHVPYAESEDMPVFYLICDVVFIPSLYDGMPNVLLEAMSLGRIVAAGKAGGIPDVIEHGIDGILFDPRNLDDAASALDRALAMNRSEREGMGSMAMKKIREKFNLANEITIIEDILFKFIEYDN